MAMARVFSPVRRYDDDGDGGDDCDCDDCDEVYYELECPTCAEKIVLDEDMLAEGGMKCPACGEELEFDFSELLDEIEEEADEKKDNKKRKEFALTKKDGD